MSMLRVVPVALLVVASASARRAAPAPKPSTHALVVVHATEYAFIAPTSIAAGTTTFRLVNDGKEPHQISILLLDRGKSLADFVDAMKANQPTPWATGVGGPNAAEPGQTIDATVNLDAGNYVMLCWVPSPGTPVPHVAKGMIQALAVTAPGDVRQAAAATQEISEPEPDVHLELAEYAFKFSKPLTPGKHIVQVMNTGTQDHEAMMVKFHVGKTLKDLDAWFEGGMNGPAPFTAVPGLAGLGKGRTATFTTNLTPGRYGIVCNIPDTKDGKPHSMHGMTLEFSIPAA
jgi:plastocyanin